MCSFDRFNCDVLKRNLGIASRSRNKPVDAAEKHSNKQRVGSMPRKLFVSQGHLRNTFLHKKKKRDSEGEGTVCSTGVQTFEPICD